jgi:hypothetical protein
MNRKMQQDDLSKRFDKAQVEEKHRHQAGKDRQDTGQQQAESPPRSQQGGWSDQEMQQGGRKPAMERDRDYDPDGDRVNRVDE